MNTLQGNWTDFPPTVEDILDTYVIAKSDSIEYLFWCTECFGSWTDLSLATRFRRPVTVDAREPVDGFWITLERAKELVEQ